MQDSLQQCREYLNQSEYPWIKLLMLEDPPTNSAMRSELKTAILDDIQIQDLIETCQKWPNPPLKRHNDAKHPLHQMHILLDFGLDRSDRPIQHIANKIMMYQSGDGPFLSQNLIPKQFGGSGEPGMSWILCDTPLLLHFLIRAGYAKETGVQSAVDHLASVVDDNGWRCKGSVPKFQGPGNRKDFCPFANILALKFFSQLPEFHHDEFIEDAIESIFWHWMHTPERKVRLFATGTHFRRLKYPLVWYDILNVCHTLSYFPYVRRHGVFKEMVDVILEKQQPSGGFIPESIFMNFKGWSFGQKKVESPMLSWKVYEMLTNLSGKG